MDTEASNWSSGPVRGRSNYLHLFSLPPAAMIQPDLSLGEIERIVAGQHYDPHSVLGAHPGPDGVIIRALRSIAKSVTVVSTTAGGRP